MKKEQKNKFFIPCDEANHTCDKNQYKEASFLELVKLNIHLIYCKACREYTKNNNQLSKLFKNPKVQTMQLDEKAAMKEKFKNELLK